jgi:hypothetical protein
LTITCGIDWAENHHDVALVDEAGQLVTKRHIGDDAEGYRQLLNMLAEAGGALAAELPSDHLPPGLARADPAEHVMHRGSVAAMRVAGVGGREAPGEAVLVDGAAANGKFLDKDDRLGGVVTPPPQRFRGQSPRLQGRRAVPAQDGEPPVAECVPEGKSVQRVQHGSRHGDHRGSFAA